MNQYFLLLYDEDIQDYYYHGNFSKETCLRIGNGSAGYIIIEGKVVERKRPEYEEI